MGSNPVFHVAFVARTRTYQDVGKFGIPRASGARDRWFKSSRPDSLMRWILCWYGKATVNRRDAGSIPAPAASKLKIVLWPSGEGSFLTRRRPVVRVHPGLLDTMPRYANWQSDLVRAPTRSVGRQVIAGSIPALGTSAR